VLLVGGAGIGMTNTLAGGTARDRGFNFCFC